MGTSTNGQICYGIVFEEEFEFPWAEYDIDEWWLHEVHKYKPPFEMYDDKGNYLNGVIPSRERVSEYYAHCREFAKAHPLPVQLVNCCSDNYPIWILAIPSSVKTASRGEPAVFDPNDLVVDADDVLLFFAFIKQHNIETTNEPQWLLSSYWG